MLGGHRLGVTSVAASPNEQGGLDGREAVETLHAQDLYSHNCDSEGMQSCEGWSLRVSVWFTSVGVTSSMDCVLRFFDLNSGTLLSEIQAGPGTVPKRSRDRSCQVESLTLSFQSMVQHEAVISTVDMHQQDAGDESYIHYPVCPFACFSGGMDSCVEPSRQPGGRGNAAWQCQRLERSGDRFA